MASFRTGGIPAHMSEECAAVTREAANNLAVVGVKLRDDVRLEIFEGMNLREVACNR